MAEKRTGEEGAREAGDSLLPKFKLTCENCIRMKVKCSGFPGPCVRCRGWRNLDCVFLEKRKPGRAKLERRSRLEKSNNVVVVLNPTNEGTATCATSDCWAAIDNASANTGGPSCSPSSGLSKEQAKVVEIFFDMYKNHASTSVCCKAWFARQLNKICAMLRRSFSMDALMSLVEWMSKHGIPISSAEPPRGFVDPASGEAFPPLISSAGPIFENANVAVCEAPKENDRNILINDSVAMISLNYTRNEACTVHTNDKFTKLFGKDSHCFTKLMDQLYGGVLPWGGDIFANILSNPDDVIVIFRVLAYRFQSLPKFDPVCPSKVMREVQTSHIFLCQIGDGKDVECIIRFRHVDCVSIDGITVNVDASFEPIVTATEPMSITTNLDYEPDSKKAKRDNSLLSETDLDDRTVIKDNDWMEDLLKWVDNEEFNTVFS